MHRLRFHFGLVPLALGAAAMAIGLALATTNRADAHCDTMNGPVVRDAKVALERGQVEPVLKWVTPDREQEVRRAFERALAVRKGSAEARELADMWFFETLVRLHRAGEGEPFTGIEPEGAPVDPGIEAADEALERGDVESVVQALSTEVGEGIRLRFGRVVEAKRHADESVEAGREFVEAYVDYIHYVENVHLMAAGAAPIHQPALAGEPAVEGHASDQTH